MLQDAHHRNHNYLRISLTDNCNLRCFYCMPEESYSFLPNNRLMQPDEIFSIAKIFVQQGINKIRLTGGEPLVRKDAGDIIKLLANLGVQLTITTNGTRVNNFIDDFMNAQIRSVNISLDTLQRERFLLITRRDQFDLVKENIQLLLDKNFIVKVNVVVVKGLNAEIIDFVEWTKNSPIHVRFIEFMPFDGNHWKSDKLVTWQQMMDIIHNVYEANSLENAPNDTDKKYQVKGYAGTFAVISTMSAPFCEGCNRIRLTADGKLKNCLFSSSETDLLQALRNGEPLLPLIEKNILSKHKELGGQFSKQFDLIDAASLHNRSMIAIGG